MEVRELEIDEAALFKALRLQALRSDPDAFGQTLDSALSMSDHEWQERLPAMRAQGGTILIAERGGRAVGMCGVGPETDAERVAFLWGMFVTAAERGAGVGRALLREAEQWALRRGFGAIHARVAAPNGKAIAFYRRQGYEVGPPSGALRPGSSVSVHPIAKRLRGSDREP